MKKCMICLSAFFVSLGALVSCNFENKADIEYGDFIMDELKTEVNTIVDEHTALRETILELIAEPAEAERLRKTEELMAGIRAQYPGAVSGWTWASNSNTRAEIRPTTGQSLNGVYCGPPQACCWATTVAADLAPDDEGGVNSYNDVCLPARAVDGDTGTWWNMNYTRSVDAPTLNARHGNKNTNDEGNHWITLDLGALYYVVGFRYQGRNNDSNSRILNYKVFVSDVPDLGRDPANPDTGDHPGHRPSAGKLALSETYSNNTNWQPASASANLTTPQVGRYVQLRVLTSVNNSGRDGGAAELRVVVGLSGGNNLIGEDLQNAAGKIGPQVDAAVTEAVAGVLLENGYDTETLDYRALERVYAEAGQILGKIKADKAKGSQQVSENLPIYKALNSLLEGEYDESTETWLVKGAGYYLDPDNRDSAPVITDDVNAFFDYQAEIDKVTQRLLDMLASFIKQV